MEKMITKDIEKQVKDLFKGLVNPVRIVLFTQDHAECETCEPTEQLLGEVVELSNKLTLQISPLNSELAKQYDVTLAPAFVLLDHNGEYHRVKFNGIPAGHEFTSFLTALMEMSGAVEDLPEALLDRLAKIDKPVNIKVFVTLMCPHCPGAVQKAHKLAMLNKNITGEMIEAQTFYELSESYRVSGVPKIVINETHELIGNQPIERFLDLIESI
jgi:glutaredoxin-like protein